MNVDESILLNKSRLLRYKRKRLIDENLKLLKKKKAVRKAVKKKVVSDFYNVRLDRGRQSRKFKVKQNVYTVSFRPFPQKSDSGFVKRLLSDMLKEVKERMQCNPNDYLRLNLRHPSLDSEIWYEFTQSKNLNEATILNKVQAVQQSKKDFTITDGSAEFELFHVKYPQGSGGQKVRHLHANKEKFKKGKRSVLKIKNVGDHLCLPRAIVVARLHSQRPSDPLELPRWKKQWDRIKRNDILSPQQKKEALELMKKAHCDANLPCGPLEWNKLQEVLLPEYRLKIFQFKTVSSRLKLEAIYKGKGNGKCLNVLLNDEHYDTILSMPGLTEKQYYCDYCDVGYSHIEDHRVKCPYLCSFCLGDTPCISDGSSIVCSDCKGYFKSKICYQRHLESYSKNSETSVCSLMDRCSHCQKWMSKKLLPYHKCGDGKWCKICREMVEKDHQCFVQVKPTLKERGKKLQMYIYFDFECTQENGTHVPNLCVAHRVCQYCDHLKVDQPCSHCEHLGPRRHLFRGSETLKQFMEWLFQAQPHATQKSQSQLLHEGAIVIAHNFKGYDGQFILNYLVHTACITPSVIMNGTKILSMEVLGLKFIDSYNYLPFALSKMPSAFGFEEMKKGYFPHFFNTEQNQNYVGPYPPASYYNPDDMTCSGRKAFYDWYRQQEGKLFDFQKEFVDYCISDVDILQRCCAQFRKTIQSLVQVNPFQEAITFASTANLAYRRGFMPEDSIAIIPNLGYDPARQFSMKACRWLAWMSRDGRRIYHAKNGGEINLGPYTVDGYDPESNTVYEFHGCYWHGCPQCHSDLQNENHPHRVDCTYGTLYEQTLIREHHLREQGYKVVSIWEHDFDLEMKNNFELQEFVGNLNFQDPLNPREALYGGRTNATRLFCTEGDMRYVDVCSLYPFVLKHRPFPMGHPEIITENFEEISNYFGLIQCQVLPPRGLYHPVLPYRTGGKLLFPLCRTCAQKLCQDPQYRCQHTDSERCITGTWVTSELQKALECGYQLKKIYEVWHFPEKSQDLFRSYIDTFLKIKQEASGYPPDCETEEQRVAYIRDIFDREKLMLNPIEIEKNPVKRTIAKLFLNCLWGKFAQRLQLPKIEYLKEEEQLTRMLQDSTLEIKGVELLNNLEQPERDLILINYLEKQDFIEDCPFGNVVLAAFTTAHARLHLYDTLEKLGDRVLYFDTDSIIYQHVEGLYNPTIVNSLGGWTDELEGGHITKFMSGGPKNYAFETDTGKSVQKVKGLTLNHRASQIVTMKALEKMIFKELDEVTVTYPHKIQRTKRHELLTKHFTKKYQIVYDKRQIIDDYKTLPFGY